MPSISKEKKTKTQASKDSSLKKTRKEPILNIDDEEKEEEKNTPLKKVSFMCPFRSTYLNSIVSFNFSYL